MDAKSSAGNYTELGWQADDRSGLRQQRRTSSTDGFGATPETTRGTRVLPYLSPRIHPSVRLSKPNGAGYFLSVKQWMPHDNCRDWRRKAGVRHL